MLTVREVMVNVALPFECMEMIAMASESPLVAVAIQSSFVLHQKKLDSLETIFQNLLYKPQKSTIRYLHWLIKTGWCTRALAHIALARYVKDGEWFEYFCDIFHLSTTCQKAFEMACKYDNTQLVKHLLILHDFDLPNAYTVKDSPNVIEILRAHYLPRKFNRPDYVEYMVRNNELDFLRCINEDSVVDIRRSIKPKDLAMASEKNHAALLRWVHEACPCFTDYSVYCMFPSSIRSHENWWTYTNLHYAHTSIGAWISAGGVWYR